MDMPSDALWEVIETLLDDGKEPLACETFRWSVEYAFLCGLKNAPVPVVITKFEQSFRPLRFHLDARLGRTWTLMMKLWRRDEKPTARRHCLKALNNYYLYALEVSREGAIEGDGFWSINTWH